MDATQATTPSILSLEKGQKIDLTKSLPGLLIVCLGLGWNPRTTNGEPFDLDAAIIVLRNGKWTEQKDDILYFGSPSLIACERSLTHSGDNLTGVGDGDDETLTVDLARVPADVTDLLLVVNIFQATQRNQNFGKVDGAYCRIYDKTTNNEIAKYDLSEDGSAFNAMVFGKMYRHNGEWKFQAIGEGKNGNLEELALMYS